MLVVVLKRQAPFVQQINPAEFHINPNGTIIYPLNGNPPTISVRSRPESLCRVGAAAAALLIALASGNKKKTVQKRPH
jgi:hypothetical protein